MSVPSVNPTRAPSSIDSTRRARGRRCRLTDPSTEGDSNDLTLGLAGSSADARGGGPVGPHRRNHSARLDGSCGGGKRQRRRESVADQVRQRARQGGQRRRCVGAKAHASSSRSPRKAFERWNGGALEQSAPRGRRGPRAECERYDANVATARRAVRTRRAGTAWRARCAKAS